MYVMANEFRRIALAQGLLPQGVLPGQGTVGGIARPGASPTEGKAFPGGKGTAVGAGNRPVAAGSVHDGNEDEDEDEDHPEGRPLLTH